MSIGIQDLLMGELAQLEEVTDMSMTEMGDESKPKAGMMTGLAWLIKRRSEPAFTFNEAEALTLAEVSAILGNEDDEPSK